MDKNNEKKQAQLGMPIGTASAKLRKMVLFSLLKKHGENFCYQCNLEIETAEELSIEHKIPWLDSEDPIKLFFDLENISFSHLSCNVGARKKSEPLHGTYSRYWVYKCRCPECKEAKRINMQNYRSKRKV